MVGLIARVFNSRERDTQAADPDAEKRRTANLFHCDPCGETYIAAEIDDCPRCHGEVTRVPNEADLGL